MHVDIFDVEQARLVERLLLREALEKYSDGTWSRRKGLALLEDTATDTLEEGHIWWLNKRYYCRKAI